MTLIVALPAFANRVSLTRAMSAYPHQEYFPPPHDVAGAKSGTDGMDTESSVNRARDEMIFERVVPSCYLRGLSSVLLEQSASASRPLDEMPAEDMHRAVFLKISQVYPEICGAAERMVASSPRELDHDKEADSNIADGMSAGG